MQTKQLIGLDSDYYMNTFGPRGDVVLERGEGCIVYDLDGNSYVDFLAGIAVNALGHNHPVFTKALEEQLHKLIHVSNFFYTQPQAQLAQKLCQVSGFDRAFFANSGTEANEGAIKLARKYFYKQGMHKYKVITAKESFHGRTMAMVAATGQEKYQKPYHPLHNGFVNVAYNDIAALKNAIDDETAAVMLEPIQGESGVIVPDDDYLQNVRDLCNEHGILLIFDEVQTGIGRTGKMFAFEHSGVRPDIMTLAKALGNGVPIGAVLAKETVCAFEPGDHGTTFGGNPFACAAGLSVLSILEKEFLVSQAEHKGSYFKARLDALMEKHDCVVDVRGKGLMLGLELCANVDGKKIVKGAFNSGFIINCAGHNTLRFVPPLIVTLDQIDMLLDVLDAMLTIAKA